MSYVAPHGALMSKDVVPVVTEFTTGTEGGQEVLGYVYPQTAISREVLLAQPAGGVVVVAAVTSGLFLRLLSNPAVLL